MGVYDAALVVFQAVPYAWGGSQLHLYSAFGAGGRALALFTAPLLRRLASTERSKLRMTQAMFATYALVTLLITATQDLAVICAMNLLAGLTMTTAFGTLRSFFSIGVHASAQVPGVNSRVECQPDGSQFDFARPSTRTMHPPMRASVRAGELTKSRKIPTRNMLRLFVVARLPRAVRGRCLR